MMVETRSGSAAPVHNPPPDQADRIAASRQAPAHVPQLQWQLATPAERHTMIQPRPPTSPPGATGFHAELTGTQPKPALDRQMALLANDAYNPMEVSHEKSEPDPRLPPNAYRDELAAAGWKRVDPAALGIEPDLAIDPRSGFQAAIYRNDENQYVVAFAGTDPGQHGDLKADGGQGVGIPTSQYAHAVKLAREVQHEVGAGNVAFTGHSLGGGLAATAAAATHENAVTFNAAGVHNETLRDLGYGNPNDAREAFARDGTIRSYAVAGDPLTTLGVSGAPGQLGTPWTMPLPAKDAKGNPLSVGDPGDLLTLHGGGGANQLFVDGLAPGAKPLQPGIVKTPCVEQALGLGAEVLQPFAPGLSLGLRAFDALPPAGRGAVLDVLGAGGAAGKGLRNDAFGIADRLTLDSTSIWRHVDALDPLRQAGAVANAEADLVASGLDRGAGFVGQVATAVTDGLGEQIRSTGHALHVPEPVVGFAAHTVEGAGNGFRQGVETVGSGAGWLVDKAGDAVAGAAGGVASAGEAVGSGIVSAGSWTANQVGKLASKVNPLNWW